MPPTRILSREEDFALLFELIWGVREVLAMGEYIAVFILAALVATAELTARYKDSPSSALSTGPAYFYILLNGVIGLAALYVLDVVAPDLLANDACTDSNPSTHCPPLSVGRVFAAAFGSLVIMRSAFARMSIGGQDIGVGPSAIIEIFQSAADRSVDRRRAASRIDELPKELRRLPLDFANSTLMALCVELMQNLTAEEKQTIEQRIKLVPELQVHEQLRPLVIALILQEFVGKDVLAKAVKKILTDYHDVIESITQQRGAKAGRVDASAFGS